MKQAGTNRRWRPFWVHQGAEYLLGLALVAAGIQSPTPTFPVLAGGLIVVNAAVVTGPVGAFRLFSRSVHRVLDLVVVGVVLAMAALPFLDIDSTSRLTMVVIAAVMGFLWLSTNFDTRAETRARPGVTRSVGVARLDSERIGRTAGRLVGKAGAYARKRREGS